MRKNLLFFIALLLSLSTFGQSDYSRGFQNGYKAGYCYNDPGCINFPPIPPMAPIPRIGESLDNYQDGYNRGFKRGLEDKQAKKSSSSGKTKQQGDYSAPFFGASSFDPVEFNKRQGLLNYQDKRLREENIANNTVEGLEKLMVDLKTWDDKSGLAEITRRLQTAKEVFMDATRKGVNVFNPTTPEEIQLFIATTDYLEETKALADMRNAQGLRWGVFQKAVAEDKEGLINYDESYKKGQEILSKNSIKERGSLLDNFIVYKPISEENKVKSSAIIVTDNAEEYNNRGATKHDLQDYRGAIADYNKAIEIDPKYTLAYNNRGNAKYSLQDSRGAIADYTKAIEIDPKYTWAYNNRGLAKYSQQDYRGAIADNTKAIELKPENAWAYYVRGNAKGKLQDSRGAIADYTKAIEIDPKYGEAYYGRGMIKIKLGQKDSGCLDLSKAGELGDAKAYDAIKKYCN